MITDNPHDIYDSLTIRQKKWLCKIAKWSYRAHTMLGKRRSQGYRRAWTIDGVNYNYETLTFATLRPLWDKNLIRPDKGIMRLTPLGGLVHSIIQGDIRKRKPKPIIYYQDESGQYNMDI